jgi:hypothetical protein
MTLGERCDEIMRLIDEALAGMGVGPEAGAPSETPTPATRFAEGGTLCRPAASARESLSSGKRG